METQNEKGFNPNLALNEFETQDGLIYPVTKSENHNIEMVNSETLKSLFQELSHKRGKNRENALSISAKNFLYWLSSNNNKGFAKEHLNLFLNCSKANRNKITNLVINYLLENKLIEKVTQKKTFYCYRTQQLRSSEPTKTKGSKSLTGNNSIIRESFERDYTFYLIN